MNPWVGHWDIKRFMAEVADYPGIPITYANMQGWKEKDQFDDCMEAFGMQQESFSGFRWKRHKKRAAFATLS